MNYEAWKLFIDALERGSLSKVALAYGTSQPQIAQISLIRPVAWPVRHRLGDGSQSALQPRSSAKARKAREGGTLMNADERSSDPVAG